jgi:hypothetical protein
MCDACAVTARAEAAKSRVDILERRWRTDDGAMVIGKYGEFSKCAR